MGQEADAKLQSPTRGELLQASIELTNYALSYIKSMALRCAIQLGVADAIHRCGGQVSLDGLLVALSLSPSKLPYLRRVMRVLTTSGVFAQADGGGYRLTPVSTLLLSDTSSSGCRSLLQLAQLEVSPLMVSAATNLAEWFTTKDEETPFAMTFGTDFWGFCGRDPGFSAFFNGAMECDSRFLMDAVIHEMGHVFDGVTSMVDVAGGTGGAAKGGGCGVPAYQVHGGARPSSGDPWHSG